MVGTEDVFRLLVWNWGTGLPGGAETKYHGLRPTRSVSEGWTPGTDRARLHSQGPTRAGFLDTRSKDATNGAPGLAARSKKLLGEHFQPLRALLRQTPRGPWGERKSTELGEGRVVPSNSETTEHSRYEKPPWWRCASQG